MSDIILLYLQLFSTFFVIGIFTFGGGYAMLSLIQTQVVTAHAWMTESQFTDIVAISQMTPGPVGINCATYVGYDVLNIAGAGHMLSILGSFWSTFALMLPSFLIVLTMVRFYQKVKDNKLFAGVMRWVRPAVCGLIGAAAVMLIIKTDWSGTPLLSSPSVSVLTDNFIDWKSWILFAAAMVAALFFRANPILIIICGGIAGLLLY